MPKEVYCGAKKKLARSQQRGTMKQCYDRKQVRYWGADKIHPDFINIKEIKTEFFKTAGLRGKIKAEITKLREKKYPDDDDGKKIKKLQKQYDKLNEQVTQLGRRIKAVTGGGSKGGSRRGSRKGSIKRGSRKGSKRVSRKGSIKGSKISCRRGSRKGTRKGTKKN